MIAGIATCSPQTIAAVVKSLCSAAVKVSALRDDHRSTCISLAARLTAAVASSKQHTADTVVRAMHLCLLTACFVLHCPSCRTLSLHFFLLLCLVVHACVCVQVGASTDIVVACVAILADSTSPVAVFALLALSEIIALPYPVVRRPAVVTCFPHTRPHGAESLPSYSLTSFLRCLSCVQLSKNVLHHLTSTTAGAAFLASLSGLISSSGTSDNVRVELID